MSFIQTSGDVLNLVIAICVIFFTFFLCWLMYYTVMAIRNIYKATKKIHEGAEMVEEILSSIKKKVKGTTSYFYLAGEGVKKLVDLARDHFDDNKKEDTSKKPGSKKTSNQKKSTANTGKKTGKTTKVKVKKK